jgi:hypothetical protein
LAVSVRVRKVAEAQRRLYAACQRLALDARIFVPFDLLECSERLRIAAVGKQQLRELKLNVRGLGGDR